MIEREKDLDKMRKHQSFQQRFLTLVQPVVESLQQRLKEGDSTILVSKHALYRETKRNISYSEIETVILTGKVIEYQGDHENDEERKNNTYKRKENGFNTRNVNVILMAVVNSRPLHVCVNIIDEKEVVIKTVYDPRSRSWLWTDEYTKRVFYK